MPLYEYKCNACEHQWDDFYTVASRNKPTKKPCPKCGEKKVIKMDASSVQCIDSVRLGIRRPDNGFKEIISKIKKGNPRSDLHKKGY
jgi:putative FmdB family regulatory protein